MARVRGVDDARHPRARPAAPPDGRRAGAVGLHEVAAPVGPDAEIGHGRDLVPVEPRGAVAQLPVREEAEDLAPEGAGIDGRGELECRRVVRVPRGALGRDDRARVETRAVVTREPSGRTQLRDPRDARRGPHRPTRSASSGERTRMAAVNGPAVARLRRERHGDAVAGRERDLVAGVLEGILVVDGRLQPAVARRRSGGGHGGRRHPGEHEQPEHDRRAPLTGAGSMTSVGAGRQGEHRHDGPHGSGGRGRP